MTLDNQVRHLSHKILRSQRAEYRTSVQTITPIESTASPLSSSSGTGGVNKSEHYPEQRPMNKPFAEILAALKTPTTDSHRERNHLACFGHVTAFLLDAAHVRRETRDPAAIAQIDHAVDSIKAACMDIATDDKVAAVERALEKRYAVTAALNSVRAVLKQ
jgi:hypothetical protein